MKFQKIILFIGLKFNFSNGILFLTFYNTALIIASINLHLEIVRELLSKENIDINIRNIRILKYI